MSDELIGRVVAGRFRVEQVLGRGGMGEVFLATDTSAGPEGTRVALKVIRESLSESKEAVARFEREAQAIAALEHPNIVRFLGAGQDAGLRWLAMELLDGSTLKERIASRGAMPWRETLPILRGVVHALGAAHARGLIHRDLKPENVFLASAPGGPIQVKLLDFGVAKHTALPDGMTMTGTGIIVGTPGFVAPEVVLQGVSDDPRSDFYGLGATWFEMLTGTKPFSAATPFALAMRHLNETPPRPSTLVPFSPVPEPVERLLARMLAKAPEHRPANAATLLADLDALEAAASTPAPHLVRTDPDTSIRALAAAAGIDGDPINKTVTDTATPRPALLSTLPAAMSVVNDTPGTLAAAMSPAAPASPILPRPLIAAALLFGFVVLVAVVVGPSLGARSADRGQDAPIPGSGPARRQTAELAGTAANAPTTADAKPQVQAKPEPSVAEAVAPSDGGVTPLVDAGVDAGLDTRPRPGKPRRKPKPQLDVGP